MEDIKSRNSNIGEIQDVAGFERKSDVSSLHDTKDDAFLLGDNVRPAAERALVRKLDMRLLPTIILIFIMNYIDVSVLHCS